MGRSELDEKIEEYLENQKTIGRLSEENSILSGFIDKQIREGKGTGDKLNDFVILNYGINSTMVREKYIDLNQRLNGNIGGLVLVVQGQDFEEEDIHSFAHDPSYRAMLPPIRNLWRNISYSLGEIGEGGLEFSGMETLGKVSFPINPYLSREVTSPMWDRCQKPAEESISLGLSEKGFWNLHFEKLSVDPNTIAIQDIPENLRPYFSNLVVLNNSFSKVYVDDKVENLFGETKCGLENLSRAKELLAEEKPSANL